jgi:transcriptional regulator with XRE-family HTH domain
MSRTKFEKMIISNIRKYRIEKKMTQEELAVKSNLQTGYIGGIETGKRFPKLENLNRIANGLGVDLPYLISPDAHHRAHIVSEKMEHIEQYLHEYLVEQKHPTTFDK